MTTSLQKLLPTGYSWRELWMAQDIWSPDGTTYYVPSRAKGGHRLTLMNAASKRTTTDGVHFDGTATSNIVVAANAVQNAKAAFNITIRFKPDQLFAGGAGTNEYLFNKDNGANEFLRVYLKGAAAAGDRKLYWEQGNGAGGNQFQLTSTTYTWSADTWYVVTASLQDGVTPIQRLLVNGSAEDTDTAVGRNTPPAGAMIIGSSSDGGADGFKGVISFVSIGVGTTAAVALSAAEETDYNKGKVPATAKVQYLLPLDEGRGLTAYDKGSAGGNGTIDSACTWDFNVRQACVSLDAINDYLDSSADNLDLTGNLSVVLIMKVKSTYDALSNKSTMLTFYNTPSAEYVLITYSEVTNTIGFAVNVGGVAQTATYATKPAIDDCLILIGTVTTAGAVEIYGNGIAGTPDSGAGVVGALPLRLRVGTTQVLDALRFDMSRYIAWGIVNGALPGKESLDLSRRINAWLNLGLTI